jgi:predicted transcriptional regulator
MTLDEVRDILEAEVLAGGDLNEIEVRTACGADLMSDVLAFSKSGALLLTGLTNAHVVRTCEMVEMAAICFVRGKMPPEDTVRLAAVDGLPLLTTRFPMFEACGRLYRAGLKGCSEDGR